MTKRFLVETVATVRRSYEVTAHTVEDAIEDVRKTAKPTFSEDDAEEVVSANPISD